MSKHKTYYAKRSQLRRRLSREAFGNQCGCCGYSKHPDVLEFHHIEPREDVTISHMITDSAWRKVVGELRKCVLVCPTCHVEIHLGLRKIPEQIKRFDEEYATYTVRTGNGGFKIVG